MLGTLSREKFESEKFDWTRANCHAVRFGYSTHGEAGLLSMERGTSSKDSPGATTINASDAAGLAMRYSVDLLFELDESSTSEWRAH